jgi:hypothetical protein
MSSFINDAHAALPEPALKLVTAVENSVTRDGRYELSTVGWTVIELVREAMFTSLTFFHLWAWFILGRASAVQAKESEDLGLCLTSKVKIVCLPKSQDKISSIATWPHQTSSSVRLSKIDVIA